MFWTNKKLFLMATRWKGKHKGPPTVTPLSQAPPGELFSSICFPGDIRTVNSRCAHEQLLCTWAKSGHADLVDCLVVLCYILLSLYRQWLASCWWSASILNFLHNSIDSNCNTQLVCAEFALDIVQGRVAEVAREHGWHPPKSLDSDENLKPEHTLFCRELRFVAI